MSRKLIVFLKILLLFSLCGQHDRCQAAFQQLAENSENFGKKTSFEMNSSAQNSKLCSELKCRAGRICSVTGLPFHPRETCTCNNPSNCLRVPHSPSKNVCGSNGQFYLSHCELHSVACVTRTHITVMSGPDHCLRIGSMRGQGGVTNNDAAWDDDNDDDDDDDDHDANETIYSNLGNITRSVEARLSSPLLLHCLGSVNGTTRPATRRHPSRLTNGNKGSDKKHLNVAGRASDAFTWTKDGNIMTWRRDLVIMHGEFIEFSEVTYHDIGIYTCLYSSTATSEVAESMQVLSKFKLTVRSAPIVRIFPPTQFHTPGDTIRLQCHVISDPPPSISWHINEEPLNLSLAKYQMSNGNRTLEIFGSNHKIDTGAYKCLASNNYEAAQDIATVFVEDANIEGYNQESVQGEEFMLLTRSGVKVVDPTLCRLQPIGFRLSSQLLLHHPFQYSRKKKIFHWESVVIVKSRFVFASLKKSGIIFRMDTSAFKFSPVEKINVGKCIPTRLRYLVNFDEVWCECITAAHATGKDGRDGDDDDDVDDEDEDEDGHSTDDDDDDGDDDDDDDVQDEILSTIVVIKNASLETGHEVHFIDLEFEMVKKIFIPPINDLNFTWSFAFLSITTSNNNINSNINNNINSNINNINNINSNINNINNNINNINNINSNINNINSNSNNSINSNINSNINNSNNNINSNKLLLFNLTSKQLTNRPPIDLSNFRCTTENVHHVVFGGKVIIECAEDALRKKESRKFHYLQLDLTTQHLEVLPLPQSRGYHLSPDSKLLTGISNDLTCLIIYRVTPEGALVEVTNTAVMDWLLRETIFIGSPLGSYDIAVECLSNQELLKYDVRERRVDILNKRSKQETNQDLRRKNHFQNSGVLSNYIMTSHGTDELVLLDAWNNSEKCSWKDVIVDFALWIDPVHF